MKAWLEINLDNLAHNYQRIRNQIGSGVELMAVVKADAYGYGLARISQELDVLGVDAFAVISLEEAQLIRRHCARPVLIMGYLDAKELVTAIDEGFILSLYDRELVTLFERIGERLGKMARVHLKVETGLNRLGLQVDDAADLLTGQHRFPHLSIEAIFSHLAAATNRESNLTQLKELQDLLVKIQGRSPLLPIHMVSSYALGNFPEGRFDMVRVGLAFYGEDEVIPGLLPTLTAKAVIMQVKPVEPGQGVGYGPIFTADRQMTVAVVNVGYADGYTQALSSSSASQVEVLVRGVRVKVIGKIAMNLMAVDVTNLVVKRGDEVVLIGAQKTDDGVENRITLSELAKWLNLRHHEIIMRFGTAQPRVYKGGI